jgi:hypothetical protein
MPKPPSPKAALHLNLQREFFAQLAAGTKRPKFLCQPSRVRVRVRAGLGLCRRALPFSVNQIAATDTQTDRLVYDDYGLTEEEIKIVKGAT